MYHVERHINETNGLFDDGSHIIYVNGNYKSNDAIGKLIDDFHQTNPENMHYRALAQSVKHIKETEKRREQMCKAVENYAKEYAAKEKLISIQNLIANMKFSLDQALNALGIQGNERTMILNLMKK